MYAADEQVGRMLVEGAFLDQGQLQIALGKARSTGKRLREVLLGDGMVTAETYTTLLSVHLRVPIVDLQQVKIDEQAVKLIPEEVAREHRVLPISVDGDVLRVAMEEPQDVEVINQLSTVSGKRIRPVLPLRGNVVDLIGSHYKLTSKITEAVNRIVVEAEERPEAAAVRAARAEPGLLGGEAVARAPVVRALEMIISQAVKDRASDIHVEPMEEGVRVRYRIDGVLHEAAMLPKGVQGALVSRVKVLAGMDIAERRRPQDGQFSMSVDGKEIDFRVASIETAEGEKVNMRILDKATSVKSLTDLGFQPNARQVFQGLLGNPFGMVVVSGPTGSGKTTTLYAALNAMDSLSRNIMTIEDPVEYKFKGINQIQVNAAAGITFAGGLRATMRLDPDVILVGEIRDQETAHTAIQAALTGHLVLTTVHANDSAGAIVRLIDLGVERFLVTSAVVGSIAQRLVRKVCQYCKTLVEVGADESQAYQREMTETRNHFFEGRGCNMCSRTGYTGRVGVYEVLPINDQVRALISRGALTEEIRAEAIRGGMISMRRDGMMKARDGITTPGEILRNVFSIV